MRFVIVVMDIFDVLRQSLQKQLRIVFNENHVAGIGQPPADGKNRLCRTLRRRQAVSFCSVHGRPPRKARQWMLSKTAKKSISLDS